jgi:hypothetical protein
MACTGLEGQQWLVGEGIGPAVQECVSYIVQQAGTRMAIYTTATRHSGAAATCSANAGHCCTILERVHKETAHVPPEPSTALETWPGRMSRADSPSTTFQSS